MNPENLKVLAERASTVEGRRQERLDEVHARIGRVRRHRQVGAVTAAVVAVVLALTAGVGLLALTDTDRTPPAQPAPRPTEKPQEPDGGPAPRQLVWAVGDKVHIGDRTIDVGGEVAGVAAVGDGAVFTTGETLPRGCKEAIEGCSAPLRFTDGDDIVDLGRAFGTWVRGYRVEVSGSGSTVVWFEPTLEDRGGAACCEHGQYVVYDTEKRRAVARFGSGKSAVEAVYDDSVYWVPDGTCRAAEGFHDVCRTARGLMRLEPATGKQTRVSWAQYDADRRSRPRTFVTLFSGAEGRKLGPWASGGLSFRREGRLLEADGNGDPGAKGEVARTGEPVRLRLPAGYREDVQAFFFHMWLDDDRFAIAADNRGDLLICRLSSMRCRIVARGPADYGFGGHG